MARILILHPGAMGAAVGRSLVDIGHDVLWMPEGRGAATRRRAQAAGLRPAADVRDCDLIVSVCPPAAATTVATKIAVATAAAPATPLAEAAERSATTPIFLDANAIAPATASGIAAIVRGAGLRYVDGGIIGPPPQQPGTTRLYLSGADAPAVADLFAGARIEPRVITGAGDAAASGLKMVYAAWSKISAALLVSAEGAADRFDLRDALRAEWQLSQPDLADRTDRALAAAATKGWRWEAEMREIAATFAAIGEPPGFGLAAAELFSRFARPESEDGQRS